METLVLYYFQRMDHFNQESKVAKSLVKQKN